MATSGQTNTVWLAFPRWALTLTTPLAIVPAVVPMVIVLLIDICLFVPPSPVHKAVSVVGAVPVARGADRVSGLTPSALSAPSVYSTSIQNSSSLSATAEPSTAK